MLRFETMSGGALSTFLPELARLRITVFREWPYLHAGDLAYEERHLHTYVDAQDSIIVLARDDDAASHCVGEIFYLAESVLLPAYRGHGAGVAFFEHREAHARACGCFRYCCFCAEDRPPGHLARPADHVSLNAFWQRRGYRIQPTLTTHVRWREIGEAHESPKPMTFWIKALD